MTEPVHPSMAALRKAFEQMGTTGEPPWDQMTDDFVWDMSAVAWAERNEYVGREGFTEFLHDWAASFEDWSLEPLELEVIGEQIVIVARQTARARASGVPVDMVFAQIWSSDAQTGKANRARMFPSREEAMAQAEAEAAVVSRPRD